MALLLSEAAAVDYVYEPSRLGVATDASEDTFSVGFELDFVSFCR